MASQKVQLMIVASLSLGRIRLEKLGGNSSKNCCLSSSLGKVGGGVYFSVILLLTDLER